MSLNVFRGGSVKLKRRRLRAASSSRVTVATPLSWLTKLCLVALLAGASAGIGIWIYQQSRAFSGLDIEDARRKLVEYQGQVQVLAAERNVLSAMANSAESELTIERAAQRQLAAQVKQLEAENARLKEDLSFFDSLLPNATGPSGVAIRRLKIDQVGPNQLRYRLLIMQGGKSDHFSGVLQLVISGLQEGRNAMITFPKEGGEAGKFKLGFRHYQRMEGVITLPDGVTPKTVSARVLEGGQVRAQTTANL